MLDVAVLFFAGVFGGVLNSVAGGGSFITFPALLFVGIPPIMANATNTFASFAGYVSGTYAFRKDITSSSTSIKKVIILSAAGGAIGALLLLNTTEQSFEAAVPWLLLFATVLFIYGGKMNLYLKSLGKSSSKADTVGQALLALLFLLVATYGGFFNAGLGIITLSYLALAGYQDINAMNGIKLLVSSVVSLVAILVFVINGSIEWYSGGIVLCGTLVGGYVAAIVAKNLSQALIRQFVIIASIGITAYFFVDVYWKS